MMISPQWMMTIPEEETRQTTKFSEKPWPRWRETLFYRRLQPDNGKVPRAGYVVGTCTAGYFHYSEAAGIEGNWFWGRPFDLEMDGGEHLSVNEISNTYLMKTAKMIEASVLSGAMLAGAGEGELSRLKFLFGENRRRLSDKRRHPGCYGK